MSEQKVITNPVKAIKRFCFECNGCERGGAKDCTSVHCALYPFRMGRNPYRAPKKPMTEEHKQKLVEAAKKARINSTNNDSGGLNDED